MSAADLHTRVTALLGGEGGIAEAETLLADLGSEKAALEAERVETHAQSVDVATASAQAAKLHGKASQLAFEVERLGRQESAVLERLVALRQEKLDAEAAAKCAEVLKERDELLSDLKHGFPAAVQTIIGLLDRMKANDARLTAVGLSPGNQGVEYLARGFSPECGGKPGRLSQTTRLPHLHDAGGDLAWPRREVVHMWTPPPASNYTGRATHAASSSQPGRPTSQSSTAEALANAEREYAEDSRRPRFPIDVTHLRERR